MNVDIQFRPGCAAACLQLDPSEKITAEAGAMISMSGDVSISTSTHQRSGGGIMAGVKRMMSGESFFLNHFQAGGAPGEVWVATTLPGDMTCVELEGVNLIVQSGSFVACEQTVEMDLTWTGFRSLFAKEGIFWINCSGNGKVVINSFGAIYPIEVDGEYIVDTGHIVAFDETLSYSLTKAGKSWISSFLGGEGLVCKFSGTGTVWCQSHNAPGFGRKLGPMLKARS
jgi:uncharacterized protein (TIGR00266 family)